jgi:hypothetical protein
VASDPRGGASGPLAIELDVGRAVALAAKDEGTAADVGVTAGELGGGSVEGAHARPPVNRSEIVGPDHPKRTS